MKPGEKKTSNFSPLCVIIILVVAWIGVAAVVITLIVLASINLGTKSSRSQNIQQFNYLASNWTSTKQIFQGYYFKVVTDYVQNGNVSIDETNEVPNDTPGTGEVFKTYPSLKFSTAANFPLVLNSIFEHNLKLTVTIMYSKNINGPYIILPSFQITQYYLDNQYIIGSSASSTCTNTYQGYYRGLNTCLVYYTLNQICLLFDSSNGKLVEGGCGTFNSFIDLKGSYSHVDSNYARSQSPMSFFGSLIIRDIRDPQAFLISLNCGNSFCESQVSYIIYGIFELFIAIFLIFLFVCMPILISICWYFGLCTKIYQTAMKKQEKEQPKGYYQKQQE